MGVDGDESVCDRRDPVHRRAVELRQRDHAVEAEVAIAGVDDDHAGLGDLHIARVDPLDVRLREQLCDRVARGRAEDGERGPLGVMIVVESSICTSNARPAVISASSYRAAASHPSRSDDAIQRMKPPSMSWIRPCRLLVHVLVIDRDRMP